MLLRLQGLLRPRARSLSSAAVRRHGTHPLLQLGDEVAQAIHEHRPVVALESTIVSHGMPYPQNMSTADAVEAIVRSTGSTPATIAVMDGKIKVGLSAPELQRLAEEGASNALKTSRRDLAWVLSRSGMIGSTTVSGTMIAAHMAGIHVFVTGGIGGVHRGAQTTMDVSADLTELGRTPVAVVCAGVKSILDIGLTLEFLETQGVTVATLGPTDDFPSFYTPTSGFKAPFATDSIDDIAAMLAKQHELGLSSGSVIAVPIPAADAAADVEDAIKIALAEADKRGIRGAAVTPFILQKVSELTHGASLKANIALIKNNAIKGGQLAVALSKRLHHPALAAAQSQKPGVARPLVIGGVVRDITAKVSGDIAAHSSTPATVHSSWGGVARNIATNMFRLGAQPRLIAPIGADDFGAMFKRDWATMGLDTSGLFVPTKSAAMAVYSAIHDSKGDLFVATIDTNLMDTVTPEYLKNEINLEESVVKSDFVVVDANLSVPCLAYILGACARHGKQLIFEPTSVPKSTKIFDALKLFGHGDMRAPSPLALITPNRNEIVSMAKYVANGTNQGEELSLAACEEVLLPYCPKILLKLDGDGARVITSKGSAVGNAQILDPSKIKSVTGAGDSMVAAFTIAQSQLKYSDHDALQVSQAVAAAVLQSSDADSPTVKPALLHRI